MKLIDVLVLGSLVCVLVAVNIREFARVPEGSESGDVLTSDQEVLDCGDVFVGEDVQFQAKVVNSGSQPVSALTVQASCGCTRGKVSCSELFPGQAAEISGLVRGSKQVGEFRHKVTLRGTVADEEVSCFVFVAGMRKSRFELTSTPVVLEPNVTSLAEGVVRIHNRSSEDFQITLPRDRIDGVIFLGNPIRRLVAAGTIDLPIEVKFSSPVALSTTILLRTDCAGEPMLRHSLAIRPVGFVSAAPRLLQFSLADSGNISAKVVISGESLTNYKLASVSAPQWLGAFESVRKDSELLIRWPKPSRDDIVVGQSVIVVTIAREPNGPGTRSTDLRIPVITTL